MLSYDDDRLYLNTQIFSAITGLQKLTCDKEDISIFKLYLDKYFQTNLIIKINNTKNNWDLIMYLIPLFCSIIGGSWRDKTGTRVCLSFGWKMGFHALGLGFVCKKTIQSGNGIKIWAERPLRRRNLCSCIGTGIWGPFKTSIAELCLRNSIFLHWNMNCSTICGRKKLDTRFCTGHGLYHQKYH